MSLIPAKRKRFCLAPWVHMHIWPNGQVFPCCMSSIDSPVGNTDRQTLQEIWNGPKMRALRLRMLKDKPSEICTRCYEMEEVGTTSHRTGIINSSFKSHEALVETTQPDGTVDRLNLPYMDIRFSNVCNFRCRTCGPTLSSSWITDAQELEKRKPKVFRLEIDSKVDHVTDGPKDLWAQLEPIIPSLEEVYFAGGEPFLSEEHFRVLQLLVEKSLFHVRLRYSTNFSKPIYQGVDVFQLWDKFENVSVGASLDAMGKRGEYLRKGQRWPETERNRLRMLKVCPRVKFFIPMTVSLMNSLHIPDFHRDWAERGLIGVNDIYLNLLQGPSYYRIQVLPAAYKRMVREKYEKHAQWILEQDPNFGMLANQFRSAAQFMDQEDRSGELQDFRSITKKLDVIRDESFIEAFPEFKNLFKKPLKPKKIQKRQPAKSSTLSGQGWKGSADQRQIQKFFERLEKQGKARRR